MAVPRRLPHCSSQFECTSSGACVPTSEPWSAPPHHPLTQASKLSRALLSLGGGPLISLPPAWDRPRAQPVASSAPPATYPSRIRACFCRKLRPRHGLAAGVEAPHSGPEEEEECESDPECGSGGGVRQPGRAVSARPLTPSRSALRSDS